MTMKQTNAKFFRKRHVITNVETGDKEKHPSISKAKQKSRQIQMAEDGALGRGSVEVIK